MKSFLLLSFIVVYNFNVSNKILRGRVVDKDTSETLVGVMVIVNEKDTTYTNMNGYFAVKNIDKFNKINLKYPSYTTDNIVLLGYDSTNP